MRRMYFPCLAMLLSAILGLAAQGPSKADNIPEGVEVIRDVAYGKGGDRPLKLQIFRPKVQPKAALPALVWIPGGAWGQGPPREPTPYVVRMAQRGYFCVAIAYRPVKEAIFPAQIEDCKCAVRFLRAKAKDYHIDPDRIGVWGSSAGGHLSALVGVTGSVKELEGKGGWPEFASKVQAVCDYCGPTDLVKMNDSPSERARTFCGNLIGGPILERKDKARQASPITYVDKNAPPFFIIHGDKDDAIPVQQSELLHEALKKAGVSSELLVVAGAGHSVDGPEIDKRVDAFFDKHLRGQGSGQ